MVIRVKTGVKLKVVLIGSDAVAVEIENSSLGEERCWNINLPGGGSEPLRSRYRPHNGKRLGEMVMVRTLGRSNRVGRRG